MIFQNDAETVELRDKKDGAFLELSKDKERSSGELLGLSRGGEEGKEIRARESKLL